MGIGAVPQAVCAALHGHRHLGVHTELICPGLAALMCAGVVDNSRKNFNPAKAIFTFAMGDRTLYEFLDGNDDLEAHPVDYVNDPSVIALNDRMVSVNATLQVDLHGTRLADLKGKTLENVPRRSSRSRIPISAKRFRGGTATGPGQRSSNQIDRADRAAAGRRGKLVSSMRLNEPSKRRTDVHFSSSEVTELSGS